MSKWMCDECGGDDPCIVDLGTSGIVPEACPLDKTHCKWHKHGVPDMPNPPPPPKQGAQFNVDEMMQKCKGCQAFYEVTAGCTLPGRCKEPGEKPFRGEIPIVKIECEPKEETTALVTADECLRVIEAYQKEREEVLSLEPIGLAKDSVLGGLADAAKLAANALQILLSFPLVTVKDADDADKAGE